MNTAMDRRLKALEGAAEATEGPTIIHLCPMTSEGCGEPAVALVVGGGSLQRQPGESAEAFRERAAAASRDLKP